MRIRAIASLVLLVALSACSGGFEKTNKVEPAYGYVSAPEGMRKMHYMVHGDLAIAEGDIVLGSVEDVTKKKTLIESSRGAVIVTKADWLWAKGNVPYEIQADMPAAQRAWIQAAVAHFATKTTVRLYPRTNETSWIRFERPASPRVCNSHLGRKGGSQTVNLGDECGPGATIHEICHALGVSHEQGRSDRDNYVVIHPENILPGYQYAFDKATGSVDLYPYDYGSVMHYRADAFSKNGLATISRRDGSTQPLGQYDGLSPGDIYGINSLYHPLLSRAVFDPQRYVELNPDLGTPTVPQAIEHWINYGAKEGRRAIDTFDARDYLKLHADIRAAFGDNNYHQAIQHYATLGFFENRVGRVLLHPLIFNADEYLDYNQDLGTSSYNNRDLLTLHWLRYGSAEGRRSRGSFSATVYLSFNPDLRTAYGLLYRLIAEHYVLHGYAEGRRAQ